MGLSGLLLVLSPLLGCVLGLDSVTYSIAEESSTGTFIGNLKLDAELQPDFNSFDYSRLTFNILAPANSDLMSKNYFFINNATGILSVQNVLDRDVEAACALRPTCVISFDIAIGPNDLFRVLTVHVQVEDVNDNSPVFSRNEIFLNVSEMAGVGTTFPLPVVSDSDGDSFGVKTMKLSSATEQFSVRWTRSINGQVQPRLELLQRLDRELVSTFDLTVTASDGGSPALSDILLVHVDVIDANDNIPQFQEPGYQARIPEDSPRGYTLLRVEAVDMDYGHNGDIRYSMAESTIEQYNTLFQIGELTGVVTIQSQLNREVQDVYFLGVVASDRGSNGRQASATVTVFVDDVNDNAPVIRLRAITDSGLAEISESADIGTFVALLSVTDQDWGRNSDVTCTLNTADFHLVAIQAKKYKLVTSVLMDRESQATYSIEIFCHDHGLPQRASSQVLQVHVTDVNDNAPVFQHGDFTVHIAENTQPGTVLGRVYASDMDLADNAKLTYSASESFSRYVQVNEITGEITTTNKLDHEVTREFNVNIIARDHGESARSVMCTVTVLVDDVNDNAPRFLPSAYTYVVPENQHNHRELDVLTAGDADEFPYNQIEYSLVGPYSSHFNINPENGTLVAIRPLDRETSSVLALTAVATDMNKRSLVGTANLTVYVGDVNDNAPRIIYPSENNNSATLSNALLPGAVIARVLAEDDDVGQNADLEYFLKFHRHSDSDLLTIDALTGEISALSRLLNAPDSAINCAVVVKDNGIPSLVTETNLTLVLNASWIAGGSPLAEDGPGESDDVNMTIIIIVVAVTLVVVLVLVVAIICVLRKIRRNRTKPKLKIEKVDLTYDVEKQTRQHGNNDWDVNQKHILPVNKIYDPKVEKQSDVDRDSCGSAEGSTTDSGRGASEEGEHSDHGKHEAKMTPSVFPGADDSIVSSTYDFNTSYDHVTIPRRTAKNNKNVTFEEDVTEISDTEQCRYGNSYTSCPAISYMDPNSSNSWTPSETEEISMLPNNTAPRRTVRNVKAKDRNKKLDSISTGILSNSNPVLQHSTDCPEYVHNQTPYTFTDSNSLLRYKTHGQDDSTGNVSEMTDATSTTSGSYIIDADEIVCD